MGVRAAAEVFVNGVFLQCESVYPALAGSLFMYPSCFILFFDSVDNSILKALDSHNNNDNKDRVLLP